MHLMLTVSVITSFIQLAAAFSGRISYYDSDWSKISYVVACSEAHPPVNQNLFAAVSVYSLSDPTSGLKSGVCGRCIQVQGDSGSVMVTVVDVMMRGNAHPQDLDLSTGAFLAVAGNLDRGIADNVQWWWTACDGSGPIAAEPVKQVSQKYAAQVTGSPAINGYTYSGCVQDSLWSRILKKQLYPESGGSMTIETCSKLAASQGFPLFGLEYGYECFAGYSYAYSPSPSTGCNMNCEGNNSEICGGGNAISVYTASSFRFAGCFSDDANSRVLPNLIGNSVGMTVEACAQLARVWGFSMFGLEAGKECWAGNAYEYYPKSSDQCVTACTGQNGQLCGGWGSISVYYV